MVALDGSSPLLLACKAGVLETVRLLLEFAPGELLETDHNGVSCLSFACWKGHVDVVKLLLSQPLYQQQQRDTYSHNNQPLNSKPMNHLNQQSKCGYTCLHYACVGGHGEIARLLVDAGVDEAIRDADGMQALDLMLNLAMEGAPKKSDNLLKAPLVEKPSKLAPNGFERTPNGYSSDLQLAPTTTSTISVESYWNCFTEPPLLATSRFSLDTLGRILAEREGSDVRTYLLKHRAVVARYRDTDGVSALHVACEMGSEAAVRVLCEELHMSIEVTDSLGRSPLFLASARGHVSVVRYLVESQGADVCS
eukprot:gene30828-39705_t